MSAAALTPELFSAEMKNGASVLDTRVPDIFERGFVPKSLNLGLNGPFETWAPVLLEKDQKLLLVADDVQTSISRLQALGFSNIAGYLDGGFAAWRAAGMRIDMIISIDTEEFELDLNFREETVIDVRSNEEFETQHIEGARHIPLEMISGADGLDKDQLYYIHCAGGYRSIVAASLLKQRGFQLLKNVYGGFNKIKETRVPLIPKVKKA